MLFDGQSEPAVSACRVVTSRFKVTSAATPPIIPKRNVTTQASDNCGRDNVWMRPVVMWLPKRFVEKPGEAEAGFGELFGDDGLIGFDVFGGDDEG